MKPLILCNLLLLTGIIQAQHIAVDVKHKTLSFSSNPLPNSPVAEFYTNKNFVLGHLSFQQKYAPVLVYWGNDETNKLEGFTYLIMMNLSASAGLSFDCIPLTYKDETLYLLVGKSSSLENSYGIVFAVIKPRQRDFDMTKLESLKGDEALVAYHTHPSFYEKNGLADYKGDEILGQIKVDYKSILKGKPEIKVNEGIVTIKIAGEGDVSGVHLEYDFEAKGFKRIGD